MILSILHTAHPTGFQPRRVRTSRRCYPPFILAMRSSRGFASAAPNFVRSPFRTRFRFGSAAERLNLAGDGKSPDHYAKGTPSGIAWTNPRHSPLTACRHVVSGSLSSPRRGSSHLSLALLRSLSVTREYLALRDGPRGFGRASTCRVLLRDRITGLPPSRTGLSPSVAGLSRPFPLGYKLAKHRPYNPGGRTPRFGLFRVRSPLLTESRLLSLPPGTEMFQFPGFASRRYGLTPG
jgi:hypothetical protein